MIGKFNSPFFVPRKRNFSRRGGEEREAMSNSTAARHFYHECRMLIEESFEKDFFKCKEKLSKNLYTIF